MPRFSRTSLKRLYTCDMNLVRVMTEVIIHMDIKVIEGNRTVERQKQLMRDGATKTLKSYHLTDPSKAVDVAPYPVDWNNRERFVLMGGFIIGIAKGLGVNLTWGYDWDGDWDMRDQTFYDGPHFQLKE